MTSSTSAAPIRNVQTSIRDRMWPVLMVITGALLLLWPAMLNRYPLICPDSIDYLFDGHVVLRMLLHPGSVSPVPEFRSEFYTLGMSLLGCNVSPWTVVIHNALLVSFVLLLTVRSLVVRHAAGWFLGAIILLSATTGVSWYASSVLTDDLGPIGYLSLFLLSTMWSRLSELERVALGFIAWWAMVSHPTHFLLGLMVSVLLVGVARVRGGKLWSAASVTMLSVVAFALLSQMALHRVLYGKASLNGNPPPYLMARMITDGPGRAYLQRHCAEHDWYLCQRLGEIPPDFDGFLWTTGGIWNGASAAERDQMRAQQWTVVGGTLREFPGAQLRASGRNFLAQLQTIGMDSLTVLIPYVPNNLNRAVPGALPHYLGSREFQRTLPVPLFDRVQAVTVAVSLLVDVILLAFAWRQRDALILTLAVMVVCVYVCNCLLCGVVSVVDPRFGCRVVWLFPLLAAMLAARQGDKAPSPLTP